MEKIRGKVLSVNISQNKGEKKKNINSGLFIESLGLENDAHAEAGIRQVSLLALPFVQLARRGRNRIGPSPPLPEHAKHDHYTDGPHGPPLHPPAPFSLRGWAETG